MFKIILFLAILCVSVRGATQVADECIAVLQNGTVVGSLADTLTPGKKVCSFLSIPYASPPVGTLRFRPPQPSPAWSGTLNATRIPNWCPQGDGLDFGTPGVVVSEDCLYLNVHQPYNVSNVREQGLPVMIFIHGGGFTSGSSDLYSPTRLLGKGDVILVVIHYRLGLLGFLSTGDETIPGNNGLKDQQIAIRWVSENIRAFGGNPDKVTVFGESAGGASSTFQLISPLNRGLVHGVIAQSGTALSIMDRDPLTSAKYMASRLDCPVNTTQTMVNCLKQVPWERIIEEQDLYSGECYQNLSIAYRTMVPVIEPALPGAFLTGEPEDVLRNGDIPDIPVMIGTTLHEGSYMLAQLWVATFGPQGLDTDPHYLKQQIVPDLLKLFGNTERESAVRAVASSMELAYLAEVNRSSWNESMPGLVDILSVLGIKSSVQNTAEILSGRNRSVYLYSFEHHSNNTLMWPLLFGNASNLPVEHGICHADDLLYLFELPGQFSRNDQTVSDIMLDMWLNFGIFGNPTPMTDHWTRYNNVEEPYLKLNEVPTVQFGYRNSWRPNGFE